MSTAPVDQSQGESLSRKPPYSNVIVLVLGTCVAGYMLYAFTQFMVPTPLHHVEDFEDWPKLLQTLCVSNAALRESTSVYKYDAWVNRKSVWRITGHVDSIMDLVTNQSLETTTATHPQVRFLLQVIPDDWPTPDLKNSTLYATTEYGAEHIEGRELLLVVRHDATDTTFVLNECIF